MVVALSASDLHPPVGEVVELHALVADADSASATVRWSGVDRADGARAWLTPRAAGALRVCADERCLVLEAGSPGPAPCAGGAPVGAGGCPTRTVEGSVVPKVEVDACFDDRWPRVAAGVLLFCTTRGRVDHALDLASGERWPLPTASRGPLVVDDEAWLWSDTPARVALRTRQAEALPRPELPLVVLGAGAGGWIAGYAEALVAGGVRWAARPLPDAPPVEAAGVVAWTERRPAADGADDDVWAWMEGKRVLLAGGPGPQRRPVAAGTRLGWFEPGAVVVLDAARGEERRWPAAAGFRAPLALDEHRACWEDRAALQAGTGPITIRCSDGHEVREAADVLAPSLGGGWLAWHSGDQVRVARLDP